MNPSPLTIDIVSDVVCPWCYIGKRQLDAMLTQWHKDLPDAPMPLLRWHAFQLNPEMPEDGVDRAEYLHRKFGAAALQQIHERLRAAARQAGLELELDSIRREPNTLKAHALIALAERPAQASALAEGLFAAYFRNGRDIGDDAVLRDIGAGAGLDEEALEAALDDPTLRREIAQADRDLRAQGITGVPLFVFSSGTRQAAVSGAQGAQALRAALEQVVGPS